MRSRITEGDRALAAEQELALLRAANAELAAELAELREVARSNKALTGLVVQLREANRNLVLATAGAQLNPGKLHLRPECRHRILLVEDNVDANQTLSMLLTYEGHTVVSAFDGIAGLALAREHAFEVLICDLGLPGIDGFQLIKELRRPSGWPIPFAIAISGYGQPEYRMRAIRAGFGQFFVKPIDVDALLTLIASDAVSSLIAGADKAPC